MIVKHKYNIDCEIFYKINTNAREPKNSDRHEILKLLPKRTQINLKIKIYS